MTVDRTPGQLRDAYSGGPSPIEWFTAANLDALVVKLLNDHPMHATLASELKRRKKEFGSVAADKPIRMAVSFGTTLLMARDNPTCVYTFEASHPMWELLMRAVDQKYFNGTLVLQRPAMPMTSSFGDVKFLHGAKGLPMGAFGYLPESPVEDLNVKHPYLREGEDGALVVTGADLNDLFDVLQQLNPVLQGKLRKARKRIAELVPPSAPVILEFIPHQTLTVSSLANRRDRFIVPGSKE